MTETTLERMARAANLDLKRQWDAQPAPGREWDPTSWTATGGTIDLTSLVRAALLEARTPSHAITAAVVKPGDDRSKAVLDFRAMIDAILEEKP